MIIPDLIAMSHDLPLMAAAGKLPQNTCDAWVKTVEEAVKDAQRLEWILAHITKNGSIESLNWTEVDVIDTPMGDFPDLVFDRSAVDEAMQKESEVTK
jgi:hypothetical protein